MSENPREDKSVRLSRATYTALVHVKAIEQRPQMEILRDALAEYIATHHEELNDYIAAQFEHDDDWPKDDD